VDCFAGLFDRFYYIFTGESTSKVDNLEKVCPTQILNTLLTYKRHGIHTKRPLQEQNPHPKRSFNTHHAAPQSVAHSYGECRGRNNTLQYTITHCNTLQHTATLQINCSIRAHSNVEYRRGNCVPQSTHMHNYTHNTHTHTHTFAQTPFLSLSPCKGQQLHTNSHTHAYNAKHTTHTHTHTHTM